jgi:hypothetical protein
VKLICDEFNATNKIEILNQGEVPRYTGSVDRYNRQYQMFSKVHSNIPMMHTIQRLNGYYRSLQK